VDLIISLISLQTSGYVTVHNKQTKVLRLAHNYLRIKLFYLVSGISEHSIKYIKNLFDKFVYQWNGK
jgi:hypothetical protein